MIKCLARMLIIWILVLMPDTVGENGNEVKLVFASKSDAQRLLAAEDEFLLAMSDIDRALRMGVNQAVPMKAFIEFISGQGLEWDRTQIQRIGNICRSALNQVESLGVKLPDTLFMVKTTGREEGNAQYTRGLAIFFPEEFVEARDSDIAETLYHELFHIIVRHNPHLRDSLYALIGFHPCHEIEFPPRLAAKKITNPDALNNRYYIKVVIGPDSVPVIPVIASGVALDKITPETKLLDALRFSLMELVWSGDKLVAKMIGDKPVLHYYTEMPAFLEQVGQNTSYIIHPEEILAENFVLMMTDGTDIPNPEIPARMKKLLAPAQ